MERLKSPEELKLERFTKKVQCIKRFYRHLIIYILVNLFLIFSKYVQLENDETFFEFATFSTAIFWGIGLVVHAFNVFGKNIFTGGDWEEKKINEYMNQNTNRKWE